MQERMFPVDKVKLFSMDEITKKFEYQISYLPSS